MFVRSRWLFLRLLGVVYLIAFVSLAIQITGLVGEHGLLPSASDTSLLARAWGGAVAAAVMVAGLAPVASAAACWALYWSLSIAGEEFLRFQWDALLLETGLLAVLYAPFVWRSRVDTDPEPPAAVRWVLWFLAFKLTFLSGVTKLLSGDRAWADWTALTFHYETQPIPSWTSWYMHQLPPSVHFWSAAGMFAIEVAIPWLIFAPPRFYRARATAAAAMIALQIGIGATGNYGFFNLLTIVLYLALLDDRALTSLKRRPTDIVGRGFTRAEGPVNTAAAWHLLGSALAILVGCFSVMTVFREMDLTRGEPSVLSRFWSSQALTAVAPLDSINGYGLFRVMTTERPEIVVEASADGTTFKEWEFQWKAGDVKRRPSFVEPHMPRLDWQMWFAALDPRGAQRWLLPLTRALLDDNETITRLLGPKPFDARVACVKLVYYQYHFTTWAERKETGAWWKRQRLGDLTNAICR